MVLPDLWGRRDRKAPQDNEASKETGDPKG